MTEQEINQAIAEHLGWVKHMRGDVCGYWKSSHHGHLRFDSVPNYCNDLNCMRHAWESLSHADRITFHRSLVSVVLGQSRDGVGVDGRNAAATLFGEIENATSIQRAEAFVKAVGKWKE